MSRQSKDIIAELRELLKEMAFDGNRMKFGACWYWQCRMCAQTGSYIEGDSNQIIKHAVFCPIGKILEETR